MTLQEAGLVNMWLQDQIGSVPQCLRPPSADNKGGIQALSLEAFGGIFLFLGTGEKHVTQPAQFNEASWIGL